MNIDILQKYSRPGPRYTSYPPATFFHDQIREDAYKIGLSESNQCNPQNISVYIHIPFCKQLCHFCGCNTGLLPSDDKVEKYIEALIREIQTVSTLLDTRRPLSQIHWGGGSPNTINLDYVGKVMDVLMSTFTPIENIEIAMECHPAYLELEDIDKLASMGFNRLSLGIQDFNSNVLSLVNRNPAKHKAEVLIDRMRHNIFKGVNIDLIYGLPGQTKDNFIKTIESAIQASPDRLTTFAYAHVPWVKPNQKIIEAAGLPDASQKIAMYAQAHKMLTKLGYVAIGMDHFARPDDELSLALQNNRLHRNFQGYCTREATGQVYGFGATAISQLGGGYFQNLKSTEEYINSINRIGLATWKGYLLSNEDIVRGAVINQLMCNGIIDLDKTAESFKLDITELKTITGYSFDKLKPFVDDLLLKIDGNKIQLLEDGFMVVRNIAMAFDPLLGQSTGQYSKTL